jgi:hypothetical protein
VAHTISLAEPMALQTGPGQPPSHLSTTLQQPFRGRTPIAAQTPQTTPQMPAASPLPSTDRALLWMQPWGNIEMAVVDSWTGGLRRGPGSAGPRLPGVARGSGNAQEASR